MSASFLNASPSARGVYRDVEYTRVGEVSLRMDGELPRTGEGPFPAVILVHGGGWIRGERTAGVSPLFDPLRDNGFAWFSISYRLASDYIQIGSAVEDVLAAAHFLREHAAEYHLDPSRIVLIGESAGGHLASMAALQEPKLFAGVVAFYSPSNLIALAQTSSFVPEQIRDVLKNSAVAPLLRIHLRSLSPVDQITLEAPPFLLIHGTSDFVVPENQSEEFYRRLTEARVPCELITVKGGGHGMRYWDRLESSARWRSRMIDWLRTSLRATSAPGMAVEETLTPSRQTRN